MLRPLVISGKYVISRFWTRRPIILTHSVTSKCNCRCKICDIWRKKHNSPELTTKEIFRMLDEAKRQNFAAYVAWGGEPLLRPDIPEILGYARQLGLYTSLITNGTHLPEEAEKMAKLVDLTWVSLDHDSDYHDEMRGQKGVFEKAIEGIIRLRHAKGRVAINCVLSKLNTDAVEKMSKLAHKLRVKLAFDPMEVFPGKNTEHALTTTQCAQLFSEVRGFKEQGYPILNSYEFIDHLINPINYSCAQPNIFIRVSEDGKIDPFWCQKTSKTLGDLREHTLGEILRSPSFKEFAKITKGCNRCVNSSTVESSVFYSAKRFLTNIYNLKSPYIKFLLDYATI